MNNSTTVTTLRERSESLMRSILVLTAELRNTNNEINATIEANKSAAVLHGEAIEQIQVDNEALVVLHEENVQFIQSIESIVNNELNGTDAK